MDLVALRADLDLTQAELAERLGVSNGYIGDIERGHRKVSLQMASKLEETFGLQGVVAQVLAAKIGRAA